jgi:hypothetical protein
MMNCDLTKVKLLQTDYFQNKVLNFAEYQASHVEK